MIMSLSPLVCILAKTNLLQFSIYSKPSDNYTGLLSTAIRMPFLSNSNI